MPDGISGQDYFRANLPQVADLKRKQLFDAMKNSTPSRVGIGSNGTLTGIKIPTGDVTKPLVSTPTNPSGNLPVPDTSSIQTEPQPVRMGVDLSGLRGSDRGLTQLQAMQDANTQGLNTNTVGDFVETQAPRSKHVGFFDHLKNAGKDLIINMGEYSKTHPGAQLPELLGAGGAGALVGGISPDAGDVLNRGYQIQNQEQDVANQLGIEGRQAQVVNEQNKPLIDLARIKAETQKAQEQAERENRRLAETAKYHQDLIDAQRRGRQAERNVVDGKIVEKQPDGTWKPVYEGSGPTRGDETPQQYRTRLGQFRAAKKELADLETQEADAAKRKDAAYARASSLKDWMNRGARDENGAPVYNEDVQRAEREAEAAEKYWRDFETKKSAAQAKLVQYGDVDESGNPSEPVAAQTKTQSGSAPKLTIEGAIEYFKKIKKRDPNPTEIANMQAALPQ